MQNEPKDDAIYVDSDLYDSIHLSDDERLAKVMAYRELMKKLKQKVNPVGEVVQWYGGEQRFMAFSLNVSRAAVSHWYRNKIFPAHQAVQIEIQTNGFFRAVDLPILLKEKG